MIRYALACDKGHVFESWFQNSSAYDKQVKAALIACPVCSSTKVEKTIMAPGVVGAKKSGKAPPPELPAAPRPSAEAPSPGEIEHRSIYGEATSDQAKELHEEGIEFHPLPVLPDERN